MQAGLADPRSLNLSLCEGHEPIPGFRLIRRRGRGGFGEVWEAEASGGFHVALKFVHLSPRARAAELRALELVRSIHHPNLLANFGSWQVDGSLIVGMELADRSLWDRFIEAADGGLQGLPRAELLGYMAEAASGIDYLNEPRHNVAGQDGVGVQHRDLKPQNILLFGVGAKVADMGMARALNGESAGHTGIWTFPYAAPEFFRGLTSRQSDQYGLAATYCQLRCGQLPFEGDPASVTAGHLFGQPDLAGLPEAERPILSRALQKEPTDRWPNCRAFVEALRALSADEAPELLHEPDEPASDIPRKFRSSTGSLAFLGSTYESGDTADYARESLDSIDSGESLLDTKISPIAEGSSPLATDIRPSGPPEAHEAPLIARKWLARAVRSVAMLLIIALTIVAASVRPSAMHDQNSSPSRFPSKVPAIKVADVAGLVPEISADEGALPSPTDPGSLPSAPICWSDLILWSQPPSESAPNPTDEAVITRPSIMAVLLDPSLDLTHWALPPRSDPAPVPAPSPPILAKAAENRGRAKLAQSNYERAIADFDEAIRLQPGLASSYFHRGVAHHWASHYPEALADYGTAIRLQPDNATAFIARGQALHDLGAYDRAITDYVEAIRLHPDEASTHYRLGMSRYRAGYYSDAIRDFDEAIRLNPKDPQAHKFRSDALSRIGSKIQQKVEARSLTSSEPPPRPEASIQATSQAPARIPYHP